MEIAGLVLGAVPLAITALRCYKSGKDFTSLVLNRKRHIESLARALQGYDAILELNLMRLLKAVAIYEEHHTRSDIPSLMQDAETIERMEEFLGVKGSEAFQNAIYQAQEVIRSIALGIRGFLPEDQSDLNVLAAITVKSRQDIEIRYRKGIKLALDKSEIDKHIATLDAVASLVDRLLDAGTAIRQVDTSTSPKTFKKLAGSLNRVRDYANQLYTAIVRGWVPGCHSAHDVKLYLEDRAEEPKSPACSTKRRKPRICFKVIFASGLKTGPDMMWCESEVEIVEDRIEEDRTFTSRVSQGINEQRATFSLPTESSFTKLTTVEVQNICLSIAKAKREQRLLRLYLHNQQRLHCNHMAYSGDSLGATVSKPPVQTVSLMALLSASSATQNRSRKMLLKPRMLLASVLASTLLQLSATPWFGKLWSKDTVYFLVPASNSQLSFDQDTSMSVDCSETVSSPSVNPAEIDLTRPFISETFENRKPTLESQRPLNPRTVMLELGIMLLELWHETTFEAQYPALPSNDDHYTRVSLAHRWLEESETSLIPPYYEVTARCIRCLFDGIPVNPTWEDEALSKGIIRGVIEPLHALCMPSQS